MMFDRQRVGQSLGRAEAAFAQLSSATTASDIQANWEAFNSEWRTAFNRLGDLATNTDRKQVAGMFHAERMASPVLTYVWEARNLEEHQAKGSTDLLPPGIMLRGSGPANALSFGPETDLSSLNWERFHGDVYLNPVPAGRKKGVLEPPEGHTPVTLAAEAIEFLRAYAKAVL